MTSRSFDIAILGSGPVGCALALALARYAPDPGRIALMGPLPATRPAGGTIDPRALALNHGSRQWLEQLGAWPGHWADILSVHVSQAGYLGRTLIDASELDAPRLGSVVAYDELLDTLQAAVAQSGVTRVLQRPARPHPGCPVTLALGDETARARLVLLSDGERPQGVARDYDQQALLAVVRATAPAARRAFERFTRHGPLALLPHPAGGALYNVVWCLPPARAQALMALPAAPFDDALRAAFGTRLGRLESIGSRHTFTLELHAGPSLHGTGIAALGNAAQTLHPVAGQGLNLGLRDAAQLAQALAPWLTVPETPVQPILERYACRRRPDRALTLAITDALPRVFATANPLQRHACSLALLALDLCAPLRRPLARHLMQGQRV